MKHGTIGGYSNQRCRCAECTEAWRVWHLAYMHRKPEQRAKNRERNVRWYESLKADPVRLAKYREAERARYTLRNSTHGVESP